MINYLVLSELSEELIKQYKDAIQNAFPDIILSSKVIAKYWDRVESYFPEYQIFLIENNQILGFMNAIPLHWDSPMKELPKEGWDWMLEKGVIDYEKGTKSNTLGALQIIVTKENLGKGYSKTLISEAKQIVKEIGFEHFIIPIRPTFKSRYPNMEMEEYIILKDGEKIYDPWIRTHLKGGAEIINVCSKAMHIDGDINFWERLLNGKVEKSGSYIVEGALNPVHIDIENNLGTYFEDNIWISYPKI
ncbi:MAG: hypothetical protein ACI86M_003707 [Saprospiraceae bacterium]|jgi:hypothetical protein